MDFEDLLPPLPPATEGTVTGALRYSVSRMREYARAAVAAYKAQTQPPADVNVAGETAGGRLGEMPPLPRAWHSYQASSDSEFAANWESAYTADQMREYGQQCAALARSASQPPAPASRSGDAGGEVRHPVQPLIVDPHGRLRFKRNAIVDHLAEGKLNDLAMMGFPQEDWEQLAQLIGYSLDGFGTLSYVTDETWDRAASHAPDATLAATSGATSAAKVALLEAVKAIYFDDSSDFGTALLQVVKALDPDLVPELEADAGAVYRALVVRS